MNKGIRAAKSVAAAPTAAAMAAHLVALAARSVAIAASSDAAADRTAALRLSSWRASRSACRCFWRCSSCDFNQRFAIAMVRMFPPKRPSSMAIRRAPSPPFASAQALASSNDSMGIVSPVFRGLSMTNRPIIFSEPTVRALPIRNLHPRWANHGVNRLLLLRKSLDHGFPGWANLFDSLLNCRSWSASSFSQIVNLILLLRHKFPIRLLLLWIVCHGSSLEIRRSMSHSLALCPAHRCHEVPA